MEKDKPLNKSQQKLWDLISQGWIPYQVHQTLFAVHENQSGVGNIYQVNSASTIGHRHTVQVNAVLGLTCSHEWSEHNTHSPCNHIKAVQEYLFSDDGFTTFDQEVHVKAFKNGLRATKTKTKWEWLIGDYRGLGLGCMGVTVADNQAGCNQASWWTTYEGNHNATWDNSDQAIEYLLSVVSF